MRGVGGDSPGGEYERCRGAVLGMLAKRFPRLDEDERLAIYHDAWTRVLVKRRRGEKIASLRAYLLATAGAEALNLLTRRRAPIPVGPDDPRLEGLVDGAPPPEEQVVTRDQARIARGLLDTLDARQRDVLKLRWDLQLSGSEVRAALGLSERQYRRLVEEGAAALAGRVEELESGQWSRRTRSLLVACLVEVTADGERRVGIASRRQREEAQRLLDTDPHVAALYAEVRRSVRGAAALLPLPVFAVEPGTGPAARLLELASEVRGQVVEALEALRSQATSIYLRAADPTLLAGGPRPGTAAIAVAGTLALGGGVYGTYEAVSAPEPAPASPAVSAPPAPAPPPAHLRTAARQAVSTPDARPLRRPARRRRQQPATTAPPQPTPIPAPTTSATPPTPASPQPTQPTPQPNEFGFED